MIMIMIMLMIMMMIMVMVMIVHARQLVSASGMRRDPAKASIVTNCPTPVGVFEAQLFGPGYILPQTYTYGLPLRRLLLAF